MDVKTSFSKCLLMPKAQHTPPTNLHEIKQSISHQQFGQNDKSNWSYFLKDDELLQGNTRCASLLCLQIP